MPVPLREEAGWQLSSEDIINAISPKTKAILLCSPNNPTGTIFSQETLEEVSEAARRNGVYIFQDDIYGNMFYTEAPYNPLRSAENKKHIIRIVSFSKDFALTGWRVGYLHADVSLIPSLLSTHDSLLNCAPVISQYAALAALEISERILTQSQQTYQLHREIMGRALDSLSEYVEFLWPDGSYFFFPRIKGVENTEKFCMDMVRSVKLAVSPGEAFGSLGKGHVRLCFGKSEREIQEGMKRFASFIQTYET
jgi:aminotransferase